MQCMFVCFVVGQTRSITKLTNMWYTSAHVKIHAVLLDDINKIIKENFFKILNPSWDGPYASAAFMLENRVHMIARLIFISNVTLGNGFSIAISTRC